MSSADVQADDTADPAPVVLQVVHGHPSPEDVAAVVAVLSTRGGDPAPARPRSRWAAPRLREGLHPTPDGWRRSTLPG